MKEEIPAEPKMVADDAAPGVFNRPKGAEWLAVFAFIVAMFVVNILSYNLFPTVWADEILWSDPAINLINTGHFTTSVWGLQPAGAYWAAQSPLYCFILSGWLPLAGQSLLAIRSLNYLLISLAAILVWFGSWKFQLLSRPIHRLAILPLMLLGFGMSFCYRSARPDVTGMLCLICLGLSFSAAHRRLKDILLLLCAITAPWVGVQIGLYACVACFLAKLVFREVTFRDLVIVWGGVCLGGISMLLFVHAHGVLGDFMASLSQAAHEQTRLAHASGYFGSLRRRLSGALGIYLDDFSCLPLMIGGVYFWFYIRRNFGGRVRGVLAFLALLLLAIPFVFSFSAHFPFYYSYMTFLPLSLVFLVTCAHASNSTNRHQKMFIGAVFGAAVLAACACGLPLRLVLSKTFCDIVPRTKYAAIIRNQLKPDDVVFCDYPDFFEAKSRAQRVFSPMYCRSFTDLAVNAHEFTDAEKRSMTVLIIRPAAAEQMQGYFGGRWAAATAPFGDSCSLDKVEKISILGRRLKHHLETPQATRHLLQIWRRLPD